jgi:hypothetical protein
MDARLASIAGHRPHRLLKKDLPEVAKALAMFPDVQVSRDIRGGVEYVHLIGIGVDVLVMAEDWALIFPLIQAGFFNDAIYPAALRGVLQPALGVDPSSEGSYRYPLYQRTLLKLQELFPQDYPVPKL